MAMLGGPPATPIAWFKVPAGRDEQGRLRVAVDPAGLYYNAAYSADEQWAYLTVFTMTSEAEAYLREVGEEVTEAAASIMGVV